MVCLVWMSGKGRRGNVAGTIFNQKERLQRYSIEVSRRGIFRFLTEAVPSITPGLAQA